jgi:CRP/FNR family transcriptional regulator, dissimilatory nitrate respiration regulator
MEDVALAINNSIGTDTRMIEGVLAGTPLFADLRPAHISLVAARAQAQKLRRGTTYCRQGEHLPGLLLVVSGSIMLALKRPEGGRRAVRLLGAKECFDVATALQSRPCPVDVVALADSLVVTVPAASLLRLLDLDARFARNLLQEVSGNYLGLLEELEVSVQQSAVQRLGTYLASLAQPNGTPHSWTAHLPISKTAIAERLGITKETMSRLLRELTTQGSIQVAGREITILDRDRLASAGR